MIKLLQKRREFLCAQITDCHRIIDAAPLGKLEICRDRLGSRWYFKPENGPRRYLPKKESQTAIPLAQKGIALLRLSVLKKELRATELYLKNLPSEKDFSRLTQKESYFEDLIKPQKDTSWQSMPYRQNPSFPENLKHPSPSGHLLRSKSECLIDMELFYRKIPFRYEDELMLNGNIIYPDFTFFNESTHEFIYWEHFGKMDDPKYRKKAIDKINFYLNSGFIPGESIFFTYETSYAPLSMSTIDSVIDEIEARLYQY